MNFFSSSGDICVMNTSMPVVKTLLQSTQSARYATTPATSPAIQFIGASPRDELFPLSGYTQLRHRPQIEDFVEFLSLQQPLLHHQLADRHVLCHRFLGELRRLRVADLRRERRDERGTSLQPVRALRGVG